MSLAQGDASGFADMSKMKYLDDVFKNAKEDYDIARNEFHRKVNPYRQSRNSPVENQLTYLRDTYDKMRESNEEMNKMFIGKSDMAKEFYNLTVCYFRKLRAFNFRVDCLWECGTPKTHRCIRNGVMTPAELIEKCKTRC